MDSIGDVAASQWELAYSILEAVGLRRADFPRLKRVAVEISAECVPALTVEFLPAKIGPIESREYRLYAVVFPEEADGD
jgi:hypothetical protein